MRIAPAVAREIGQMYATAHVNEAASSKLTESSKLLGSASEYASDGNFGAALSDATTAVDLLSAIADSTEPGLAPNASTHALSALTSASAAIEALGMQRPDAASSLQLASMSASSGAGAATDAAAGYRYSADQLSREWM